MIFHLLMYSSIFFFISITGQPYYSTAYIDRPNNFSELSLQENIRFIRALTDICQNYEKNSSTLELQRINPDEFISNIKKLLKDKKQYTRFVIMVVDRITRDKFFAKYLCGIKIHNQENLCSFFIREFNRLQNCVSNLRSQKDLHANVQVVKKNYKAARYYLENRKGQNKVTSYNCFNDPLNDPFINSLGNNRMGISLIPTGIQKARAPNVTFDNTARIKNAFTEILKQKHQEYETKFTNNNPNAFSAPRVALFLPSYSEEFNIAGAEKKGISKDDPDTELNNLKNQLRFMQDSSCRDRLYEFVKKSRCENVQRFENQDNAELLATNRISQDSYYTNKTLHFLEQIRVPLFNLFSAQSSGISLLDRETALFEILSKHWPTDLPRGSSFERAFKNLKYDLQQCMYDSKGNPRLDNSSALSQKKAKAVIDFLLLAYGTSNIFDLVLKQGLYSSKIPYLQHAFNQSQRRPGRLAMTGNLFCQMAIGVGEFAHDLVFGQPNQTWEINNNSITQDLNIRRVALLQGDLIGAFEIADKYWGTPYYEKMIKPLKEHFFNTHNAYGIPKIFEEDPLCAQLSSQLKNELCKNLPSINSNNRFNYHTLKKLHELKTTLIDRHIIVKELTQLLNVDPKKSPFAKKLFYELADQMQDKIFLSDKIELINALTEKFNFNPSATSLELADNHNYNLLFDKNGRCKLIPIDPTLFENIEFDSNIGSAESVELRKLVNYFSSIDACMPEERESIRQGLKYCAAASKNDEFSQEYKNLAESVFLASSIAAKKSPFLVGDFSDGVKNKTYKHLVKLAGDVGLRLTDPDNFDAQDLEKAFGLLEAARRLNNNHHERAAENILMSDVFSDLAQRQNLPSFQGVIDEYYNSKTRNVEDIFQPNHFSNEIEKHYDYWKNSGSNIDNFINNLVARLEQEMDTSLAQDRAEVEDELTSDVDDYECYDQETMEEAHKILKLSEEELKTYLGKAIVDQKINSDLINEFFRLHSNLFKIAQRIDQQKHKKFAEQLCIRTLASMKSFTRGMYGTSVEPFLHPIELANDLCTLLKMVGKIHYDASIDSIRNEIISDIISNNLDLTGKKYAFSYADKNLSLGFAIAKALVQGGDFYYNHTTVEELSEALGGITGLFIGPLKCTKFAMRATETYGIANKCMLNLATLLSEQTMADRWAVTLEELCVPANFFERAESLTNLSTFNASKVAQELKTASNWITGEADSLKRLGQNLGRYTFKTGESVGLVLEEVNLSLSDKQKVIKYALKASSDNACQNQELKILEKKLGKLRQGLERVKPVKNLSTKTAKQIVQHLKSNTTELTNYLKEVGREVGLKGETVHSSLLKQGIHAEYIETISMQAYNTAQEAAKGLAKNTLEFKNFKKAADNLSDFAIGEMRRGNLIDIPHMKSTISDIDFFKQAAKELKEMPGAMADDGPFARIIKGALSPEPNPNLISGSFYEIEKTLDLIKQGHKVESMSYVPASDTKLLNSLKPNQLLELADELKLGIKAEFDIKIGKTLIECKAKNWSLNTIDKTIGELIKRNKFVKGIEMEYIIHSKGPLPQAYKEKLIEASIKFIEDNV